MTPEEKEKIVSMLSSEIEKCGMAVKVAEDEKSKAIWSESFYFHYERDVIFNKRMSDRLTRIMDGIIEKDIGKIFDYLNNIFYKRAEDYVKQEIGQSMDGFGIANYQVKRTLISKEMQIVGNILTEHNAMTEQSQMIARLFLMTF